MSEGRDMKSEVLSMGNEFAFSFLAPQNIFNLQQRGDYDEIGQMNIENISYSK